MSSNTPIDTHPPTGAPSEPTAMPSQMNTDTTIEPTTDSDLLIKVNIIFSFRNKTNITALDIHRIARNISNVVRTELEERYEDVVVTQVDVETNHIANSTYRIHYVFSIQYTGLRADADDIDLDKEPIDLTDSDISKDIAVKSFDVEIEERHVNSEGDDTAALIGLLIGGCFVCLCICILIAFCRYRLRKDRQISFAEAVISISASSVPDAANEVSPGIIPGAISNDDEENDVNDKEGVTVTGNQHEEEIVIENMDNRDDEEIVGDDEETAANTLGEGVAE